MRSGTIASFLKLDVCPSWWQYSHNLLLHIPHKIGAEIKTDKGVAQINMWRMKKL
jgi:hypothetical protein